MLDCGCNAALLVQVICHKAACRLLCTGKWQSRMCLGSTPRSLCGARGGWWFDGLPGLPGSGSHLAANPRSCIAASWFVSVLRWRDTGYFCSTWLPLVVEGQGPVMGRPSFVLNDRTLCVGVGTLKWLWQAGQGMCQQPLGWCWSCVCRPKLPRRGTACTWKCFLCTLHGQPPAHPTCPLWLLRTTLNPGQQCLQLHEVC